MAAVAAASAAAAALAAARWARCRAACSSCAQLLLLETDATRPPPWSSRSGRCSSHLRGEPRVKQRCQRPLVTRNEDGRGVGSGCTARIMRHESGMLSQRGRVSGAGACHPRQRTRARAGLRTQFAIARSRAPIMRVAPAATRKRTRLCIGRASLKFSSRLPPPHSPRSNGGLVLTIAESISAVRKSLGVFCSRATGRSPPNARALRGSGHGRVGPGAGC